jgi:DNA polymerase (family 10)
MKNQLVAEIFYQIADLLDIQGVAFKPRAYRRAAQTIEALGEDIEEVCKKGKLRSIPGVGEALAKKIEEIVNTGRLEYFERLRKEIPGELSKIMDIPGVGPRKALVLYNKLGIKTVEELKKACEQGNLRNLFGFGELTERNILRGIEMLERTKGRTLLSSAYENGEGLIQHMKKIDGIERIQLAGSIRRMKETIGDIDILVSSNSDPMPIMDHFVSYPDVGEVLVKGETKSSILLSDDTHVDLRVVKPESFGSALQYFTGSKAHNIKLRTLAIKKGLKISEYGVFEKESGRYVAGRTEEDVYRAIGLPYIEPELRENWGEIEAAQKNSLPNLVRLEDIKGDFHVHSNWSDGSSSIQEIVEHAKNLGYSFVGIADHSKSQRIANGLTEERLLEQVEVIRDLNEKEGGDFRILSGSESDIKPDGSLDLDNKALKELDFVCAAIHSRFKMDTREMTERIIKAMENEYVKVFAHPTGRLIGRREPYKVDMERLYLAARDNNVCLEINAFPDRSDLNDMHSKMAKEYGVKIVIGTDSHSIDHLRFMKFGVAIARRGWLEKEDILNTYKVEDMWL